MKDNKNMERIKELVTKQNYSYIVNYFRSASLSKASENLYRNYIKLFIEDLYEIQLESEKIEKGEQINIFKVTKAELRGVLKKLTNEGRSTSYISARKSSYNNLMNFCESELEDDEVLINGKKFINILDKLETPKGVGKKQQRVLTKNEVEKIRATLEEKQEYCLLSYFEFTYITACRLGEARQLTRSILDKHKLTDNEGNKIYDENGNEIIAYETEEIRAKGSGISGKKRNYIITENVMEVLKKWENQRAERCIEEGVEDDCPYVFATFRKGKYNQVSNPTLNVWCAKIAKLSGIEKFEPHTLRRSRATILYNDGMPLEKIQKLLGHESSSTTQIYIIGSEKKDIIDTLVF